MPDNPTEDMIRKEIAAARRIIREDKLIKSHGELRERLDKHFPDNSKTGDDGPPKPPDPVPPKETPKRTSLWWGEEK